MLVSCVLTQENKVYQHRLAEPSLLRRQHLDRSDPQQRKTPFSKSVESSSSSNKILQHQKTPTLKSKKSAAVGKKSRQTGFSRTRLHPVGVCPPRVLRKLTRRSRSIAAKGLRHRLSFKSKRKQEPQCPQFAITERRRAFHVSPRRTGCHTTCHF